MQDIICLERQREREREREIKNKTKNSGEGKYWHKPVYNKFNLYAIIGKCFHGKSF